MTKLEIVQMARDAGSIDSDETIQTLFRLFSQMEHLRSMRIISSLIAQGPVPEAQKRYNYAYMSAMDALETMEGR